MRSLKLIIPVLACKLLTACQSTPAPKSGETGTTTAGATTAATVNETWVRSELYCGLAPLEAEGLGLASAEGTWRNFIDEEVTPRFPDGLSVFDSYGQSRDNTTDPILRERSKVLEHFK